jgi:2-C-methyl-D-erythritol 4-phosphate cytidylyltransferase
MRLVSMGADEITTGREGVWTIVVAAGSGTRFGAPKQFLDLRGSRVIDRSVAEAARHSEGVVVVVPPRPVPGDHDPVVESDVVLRVVAGGASRSASVRRGLAIVPESAEVVVVHDAARPLVSGSVYEAIVSEIRAGADAAVPVVPLTDTIRRRSGGVVDRSDLVAVQTPQAFRADVLRAAHDRDAEATDDATLVEEAGGTVALVDGERRNLKITTPGDLQLAEAWLVRDEADRGS